VKNFDEVIIFGVSNTGDEETMHMSKDEIPGLVDRYTMAMELGNTTDWCSCQWILHPDDLRVSEGCCRICLQPMEDLVHDQSDKLLERHAYQGRRMRRGDQNPLCPVHTKEGLILGFFEWVTTGMIVTNKRVSVDDEHGTKTHEPGLE
jgi:hypothetical protein